MSSNLTVPARKIKLNIDQKELFPKNWNTELEEKLSQILSSSFIKTAFEQRMQMIQTFLGDPTTRKNLSGYSDEEFNKFSMNLLDLYSEDVFRAGLREVFSQQLETSPNIVKDMAEVIANERLMNAFDSLTADITLIGDLTNAKAQALVEQAKKEGRSRIILG